MLLVGKSIQTYINIAIPSFFSDDLMYHFLSLYLKPFYVTVLGMSVMNKLFQKLNLGFSNWQDLFTYILITVIIGFVMSVWDRGGGRGVGGKEGGITHAHCFPWFFFVIFPLCSLFFPLLVWKLYTLFFHWKPIQTVVPYKCRGMARGAG